jgi:hypothetical protein
MLTVAGAAQTAQQQASTGVRNGPADPDDLYAGETFYDILGVPPSSSRREIKAAYIVRARVTQANHARLLRRPCACCCIPSECSFMT